MADPRSAAGAAVLRGCAWALGGRCERAHLLRADRGRWQVMVVPRRRQRWTRITIYADSVPAAAWKLLHETRRAS